MFPAMTESDFLIRESADVTESLPVQIFQATQPMMAAYVSTKYTGQAPPDMVPAAVSVPQDIYWIPEESEVQEAGFIESIPMKTLAILGIALGLMNLLKK